jgi:hypothetical protein
MSRARGRNDGSSYEGDAGATPAPLSGSKRAAPHSAPGATTAGSSSSSKRARNSGAGGGGGGIDSSAVTPLVARALRGQHSAGGSGGGGRPSFGGSSSAATAAAASADDASVADSDLGGEGGGPIVETTVVDGDGVTHVIRYRGVDPAVPSGSLEWRRAKRLADNRASAARSRVLQRAKSDSALVRGAGRWEQRGRGVLAVWWRMVWPVCVHHHTRAL